MPEGLQATWIWCRDHAVITAELEGPDAAEAAYRHSLEKHGARLGAGVNPGRGLPHEIYCLLGRPQDAVRFSREYLAVVDPPFHQSTYSAAVDRYICGELSAEGLLKAARGRTERMNAHYLVAFARLADGDRAGAIEHLATADRAGNYVFSGYGPNPSWASVFLQRLREDPTWPPWIPVIEEGAATPSEDDLGEGAPDNEESP